ncbi:hypothetical protein HFD88_009241 [Aspergillus terreus]|nr:hypothetical protein HFD88_009241 [Aspergillus terreus]
MTVFILAREACEAQEGCGAFSTSPPPPTVDSPARPTPAGLPAYDASAEGATAPKPGKASRAVRPITGVSWSRDWVKKLDNNQAGLAGALGLKNTDEQWALFDDKDIAALVERYISDRFAHLNPQAGHMHEKARQIVLPVILPGFPNAPGIPRRRPVMTKSCKTDLEYKCPWNTRRLAWILSGLTPLEIFPRSIYSKESASFDLPVGAAGPMLEAAALRGIQPMTAQRNHHPDNTDGRHKPTPLDINEIAEQQTTDPGPEDGVDNYIGDRPLCARVHQAVAALDATHVWFLSATPLSNRVTDLCGYVVLLWRKAEQPTTDAEGEWEEDGDGDVLMSEDEDALTPYVRAEQTGEANITLLDPRRLATIIRRGDRKEHKREGARIGYWVLPPMLRQNALSRSMGDTIAVAGEDVTVGGDIPEMTITTVDVRFLATVQKTHDAIYATRALNLTSQGSGEATEGTNPQESAGRIG